MPPPPDRPRRGAPRPAAAAGPPPELSRRLALGLVGPEGREEVIEATRAECAALAARLGIPAVRALAARLHLTAGPDGSVVAEGRLSAAVTQDCVVTLDPVEQEVAEAIAFRVLPPGREPADGPEEMDEIPAGPDGSVDLGEAVAEQLALALDPYPRAPDAALPEAATGDATTGDGTTADATPGDGATGDATTGGGTTGGGEASGAFAALARLAARPRH